VVPAWAVLYARKQKHDFAFSGLIACGHCGCRLVGELKKKRYVYYHCTGNKGKCPEPYVREGVLEAQFTAALRRLKFDEEVLAWVKHALRQSHADERREHEAAMARLQAEHTKIQRRLDAMYDDKLDGVIDEAFFRRKAEECRAEQAKLSDEIERHRQANQNYIEDGVAVGFSQQGSRSVRAPAGAREAEASAVRVSRLHLEERAIGNTVNLLIWSPSSSGPEKRKPKTQHSNRDGDRGPGHTAGEQVPGDKGVVPISIVAGRRGNGRSAGENEIWLPRRGLEPRVSEVSGHQQVADSTIS
jgi:hypothetical protein